MAAIDTRTLDERIRAKARKELEQRVRDAFAPAFKMLPGPHWPVPGYHHGEQHANAYSMLEAIRKQVIHNLGPKAEQDAVQAFMDKVENLDGQLSDLMHDLKTDILNS